GLLELRRVDLGRMTAHVEQSQDQRRKLVPERESRELYAGFLAGLGNAKGGNARRPRISQRERDQGRRLRDLLEQCPHLPGCVAVIETSDQFDRALQVSEVGAELCFEGLIEHGWSFLEKWVRGARLRLKEPKASVFGGIVRSCRRGR